MWALGVLYVCPSFYDIHITNLLDDLHNFFIMYVVIENGLIYRDRKIFTDPKIMLMEYLIGHIDAFSLVF